MLSKLVIRVLGCTPEHVCASLHNAMPAVPSATPHKLLHRCVHLSLHLLLLHALISSIALLIQLMLCADAVVLAVVHAVGIMFAAAPAAADTTVVACSAGIAACTVVLPYGSLLMRVLLLCICCYTC